MHYMAKGKPESGRTEEWLKKRKAWRRERRLLIEGAKPGDQTALLLRGLLHLGQKESNVGSVRVTKGGACLEEEEDDGIRPRYPGLRPGVYVENLKTGRFERYTGPRNKI